MAKPSGMLQAVCIFAILLGVLGVWGGLWGTVNLAMGGRVQEAMASVGGVGMTPEQAQLQRQFYEELREATSRWDAVSGPLFVLELGLSVVMIVGAARTLRGRAAGAPTLLGVVFLCAIILELAQLVPAIVVQYDTVVITTDFLERSVVASAPPGRQIPPEMNTMAATAGKVAMIAGLAFAAAMKLAEVGFYVFGWTYLRRSAVSPDPGPLVAEVVES